MAALQIISLETTTPQLRAPASGDTYSAPRALDITPETLTGSSATSSLSIAQTWNTSGTPTAIDLNVTDTASNAASLLMNLRVGGSSVASIRKNGIALFGPTAAFVNGIGVGTPALNVGSGANVASNFAGGQVNVWDNNINVASLNSTGVVLRSAATVSWGSGTSVGSVDTILARDAANTLAQRNGVNAQAFRVYNTYTDASNYERLGVTWNSNTCFITTQAAGTGSSRPITITAGGNLSLGGGNFSTLQFVSNARQLNYTPDSLTGSQAETAFSIAQTWNTTGTPTAIDLNVTDTASNAASLLMNLRVGGSSRFSVDKTGAVVISDGSNALTIDSSNGATTFLQVPALQFQTSNGLIMRHGNNDALGVRAVSGASDPRFDFLNTSNALQVRLTIDAANTLAQRNGVNAQAFNIYNTYTDASNYERSFRRYVSNALEIGHEAAGTGTATREIRFINNATTRLTINSSGDTVVTLGRSLFLGASGVSWQQVDNQMRLNGGPLEMVERTAPAAPAADRVRIYAEDNGAGKTRLMALFATGVAQQLAVEP